MNRTSANDNTDPELEHERDFMNPFFQGRGHYCHGCRNVLIVAEELLCATCSNKDVKPQKIPGCKYFPEAPTPLPEGEEELRTMLICKTCGGDGKETCTNPDHNFIESPLGAVGPGDIGRIGCPTCGHDPEHKVPNGGACDDCEGTGLIGIDRIVSLVATAIQRAELKARVEESEMRYASAKRLLERARKWQLTEAGRHDMIMGEELMPAEDRLKQLKAQIARLQPSEEQS